MPTNSVILYVQTAKLVVKVRNSLKPARRLTAIGTNYFAPFDDSQISGIVNVKVFVKEKPPTYGGLAHLRNHLAIIF